MNNDHQSLRESVGTYYDRTVYLRLQTLWPHSRLCKQIIDRRPFALLTAWSDDADILAAHSRPGRSVTMVDCNRARNIDLLIDMKTAGCRAIKVKGTYLTEVAPGDHKAKYEIAFFAPYDGMDRPSFEATILRLCNQYGQQAVVLSDGDEVGLMLKSGGFCQARQADTCTLHDLLNLWSLARGHTFKAIQTGFPWGNGWFNVSYKHSGLLSDLLISPQVLCRKASSATMISTVDRDWDELRDGPRLS